MASSTNGGAVVASGSAPDARSAPAVENGTNGWFEPRRLVLVLLVLVLLPVVIVTLGAISGPWFPAGDWAMLELATHDVGGDHSPLVGPYSRYGWNHPGPLLFYAFSPLYRLTGEAPWSMLVVAGLVNGGALAGMIVIAVRRGGRAFALVLSAALGLLVLSIGPALLHDPWNAWITVLPFGLALASAWAAALGSRRGLIVVASVGSFLVQAHIGFALLIATLWTFSVVGWWRSSAPVEQSRGRLSVRARPLLAAGVVLLGCWAPVAVDEVAGSGNVSQVVRYFRGNGEAATGVRSAVGIAARELDLRAPWIVGEESIDPDGGSVRPRPLLALVVPLSALALAGSIALRQRDRSAVTLLVLVASVAGAGLASTARISGEAYEYLVRWWWVVAAWWWASVVWVLARAVIVLVPSGTARIRLERTAAALALGLLAITSAATTTRAIGAPVPIADQQARLASLTPPTLTAVGSRSVEVRGVGPGAGWLSDALGTRLVANGATVRAEDSQANKWGDHRRASGAQPVPRLVVATGRSADQWAATPGGQLLASWDPLDGTEQTRRAELERRVVTALENAGRSALVTDVVDEERSLALLPVEIVPLAVSEELNALRRPGHRVAVVLVVSTA